MDDWDKRISNYFHQVRTILLSIQSLLGEPNNDSPLNTHAAELWSNQVNFIMDKLSAQCSFSGRLQEVFVRKVWKGQQICIKSVGYRKNFSFVSTSYSFVTTDLILYYVAFYPMID